MECVLNCSILKCVACIICPPLLARWPEGSQSCANQTDSGRCIGTSRSMCLTSYDPPDPQIGRVKNFSPWKWLQPEDQPEMKSTNIFQTSVCSSLWGLPDFNKGRKSVGLVIKGKVDYTCTYICKDIVSPIVNKFMFKATKIDQFAMFLNPSSFTHPSYKRKLCSPEVLPESRPSLLDTHLERYNFCKLF